ncbi:MAG: helix-turn-helix domain-containing protein [Parachlamydiales bacterium]|jgi:cytoskeletal protein RodZ
MEEQKKQIGDLFKTKRLEMNLSLREIENATSIRMLYLKAIEDGNIDKLLSQVYTIGFVKQYATFLGLDGEKILKDNPKAFNNNFEKQEFDYGIGTLEIRNTSNSRAKVPTFIWVIVSVLVFLGAWFFARALGVF